LAGSQATFLGRYWVTAEMEMNEAVLRLRGSMSEEGIRVECFHAFRERMQSDGCVASGGQNDGAGIFQKFSRPSQKAFAAM
jgi:hypothetical protein